MGEKSATPIHDDERKIMAIVQKLPPERKQQVLAFARFIAFDTFSVTELDFIKETDFEGVHSEADARWDQLLASEKSQRALDKLADDALNEIRAGNVQSMEFTEEGEIAPR